MSKYIEEEEQLLRIKTGDQSYIKSVYEDYRAAFINFLMGFFKCDKATALKIYLESFTILYFNIKDGKLTPPLKSTLKTYLFGVGKLVYQKEQQGTYQKKVIFPEELKEGIEGANILDQFELESQKITVQNLLNNLGKVCQQVIQLMYFKNYEAAEVAKELGFSSAGTVRKRKFDCLNKMRELLKRSKNND